jgi:hypothetical protein
MMHLAEHLMERQSLEDNKEQRWLECELEKIDIDD